MKQQIQIFTTRSPEFAETYDEVDSSDWWSDETCFHFRWENCCYIFPLAHIIEIRIIDDYEDDIFAPVKSVSSDIDGFDSDDGATYFVEQDDAA